MCLVDNQDSGNKTRKHSEQHHSNGERISTPIMGLDNICSAPANMEDVAASTSRSLVAEPAVRVQQSEEIDTASPDSGACFKSTVKDSFSTDSGLWNKIDYNVQAYWAKKGPVSCQNKNVVVSASKCIYKHQKRHFSQSYFRRELGNGDSVSREWVLFLTFLRIFFFVLNVNCLEIQPICSQVVSATGSMQTNA